MSKIGVSRLTELLVGTLGKDPSKAGILINSVIISLATNDIHCHHSLFFITSLLCPIFRCVQDGLGPEWGPW